MSGRIRVGRLGPRPLLNAPYLLFGAILVADISTSVPAVVGLGFGLLQPTCLAVNVLAARSAPSRWAARPWWALTVGFVLLCLTSVSFYVSGVTTIGSVHASRPGWLFVGIALRIAFALALLAALLWLTSRKMERPAARKLALDAATVVGGGLMAVWYFVVGPVVTRVHGSDELATLIFAIVPVGDLALILGVCAVLLRGATPAGLRPLMLLLAGALTFLVADVAFTVLTLHPDWGLTQRIPTLLQTVPSMFLAAAAIEQRRLNLATGPTGLAARPLRPVTWLPYVALVGGFGLLAVAAGRAGLYPWVGLVVGGILMTTSVAARQFLTLRENRTLATTDPLTGLANRIRLGELLQQAAERSNRSGLRTAVLIIDLDDFKPVNDTYGHETGDGLLIAFASILRNNLRGADAAARLGGDEFAVVLQDVTQPDDAVTVATRILADLTTPAQVHGHLLKITASIGIAVTGADSATEELLHHADLAMYEAKHRRTGWRLYPAQGPEAGPGRPALHEELLSALADPQAQLRVYYQPIVALLSGAVVGVEALVRWQHPTRGLLAPDAFVPLAEQTGLVEELDAWVLRASCRQVRQWQRARPPGQGLRLSANVSAVRLRRPGLAAEVLHTLEEAGFDPHDLVLEITETALPDLSAGSGVFAELSLLRERGVRIALDDFGTGYASLQTLLHVPVDVLKLDRCFVEQVLQHRPSQAVAKVLIRFGELLELDAVAEGIETAGQAEYLRDLGYGAAQGYHFARPLPAQELWLHLEPAATDDRTRPQPPSDLRKSLS
jgi:diguanylate cyclase (GGDEF)-like protein